MGDLWTASRRGWRCLWCEGSCRRQERSLALLGVGRLSRGRSGGQAVSVLLQDQLALVAGRCGPGILPLAPLGTGFRSGAGRRVASALVATLRAGWA